MKVYLNYISLDYNYAIQIAHYLEEKRDLLNVDSPESAADWEEIVKRISEADVLVYFISPEAVIDSFWQNQLNEALLREIPVIGLLVRETDTILPSVGERQPIDMTRGSYNTHLKELEALLDVYLNEGIFSALNQRLIAIIGFTVIILIAVCLLLFESGDAVSPFDQTLTSAAQRPTNTLTPTSTPTSTATNTYTATYTPSRTETSTSTSTFTPTSSSTATYTLTRTSTQTPSPTETVSATSSSTIESGVTTSITVRETLTVTDAQISTHTPNKTMTSIPTNTRTPTHTSSLTITRTSSPTITKTFTTIPTLTITPTIDPNSVACPGTPISQLLVGIQAMVIHVSGVSLRAEPDTASTLLEYLILGTELRILEGPVCEQGFRWWKVETTTGLEGWVAEGDSVNYYVIPWEVD
jgi:hypothetical protein